MRPAVRLSALMGLPVVWVWTHDSVGLGEDGPTHQPVETYAALRAIPNLWFVRPADANETAERGRSRSSAQDGPVALSLSRQKVPTLDRSRPRARLGLERGAYTLWESGGSPDLILIATGRGGRADARGRAEDRSRTARRCASSRCRAGSSSSSSRADYRDEVLPPEVKARLSIEPGVELGWTQVGRRPRRLDLDRALRRVGAGRRPCSSSSATTSTTSSPARRRSGSAFDEDRRWRFDHRGVTCATPCSRRSPAHEVIDFGTDTDAVRIDYPDKAREVGEAIQHGDAPSAASSSAARASAPRSPPASSPASARRSATTPTARTRASSTTT